MGIEFPHRFGLAAGFDKNARGVLGLLALGFGHVEIGTVTARPQPGNPRPRLFRLVDDHAIVNRMGFNNDGAAVVAVAPAPAARHGRRPRRRDRRQHRQDQGRRRPSDAVADYVESARLLAPYASYLVVNVSSPNTPGPARPAGRRRARADARGGQGRRRRATTAAACRSWSRSRPTSPTTTSTRSTDLALELGLDGISATNTTIARPDDAADAAVGRRGRRRRRTVRPGAGRPRDRGAASRSAARVGDGLDADRGRRSHDAGRREGPASRPVPTSSRATRASSTRARRGRRGSPRGRPIIPAIAGACRHTCPPRFGNPAPDPVSLTCRLAPLAQSAERFHGKEKVYGSIP